MPAQASPRDALSQSLDDIRGAGASGAAQSLSSAAMASANRTAAAALQSLASRIDQALKAIESQGRKFDDGLKARAQALAIVEAQRADGQVLSDKAADTLKTAIAKANNIDDAGAANDLATTVVSAVNDVDQGIDTLGEAEKEALATAKADLEAKQQALADAETRANDLIAAVGADASAIGNTFKMTRAGYDTALKASEDSATLPQAMVGYADYASRRSWLLDEQSADRQSDWSAISDAWLAALNTVAQAEKAVIDCQCALDLKLAERPARQQSRNQDAAKALSSKLKKSKAA
ncbi:MAG: hypothetical protein WA840_16270 [Caulobacteraceae bacterium]